MTSLNHPTGSAFTNRQSLTEPPTTALPNVLTESAEVNRVIRTWCQYPGLSTHQNWRANQLWGMVASTTATSYPILWNRNSICSTLTLGTLRWTRKIRRALYKAWLYGPSVMIPITISSWILSITSCNLFSSLKTSCRPLDLLPPAIPSLKLISTSMMVDERVLSTFPTPPDGRCTIGSTGLITSCQHAEKPARPHEIVLDFSIFET